jgi:hypothetical protein
MIGGIWIAGAALVLYFWQHVLIVRQVGGQKIRLATARRLGSVRQDSCLGAVWFGVLVVIACQAFQQVQRGAPAQSIMLSLAAVAAGAFSCGVFFGRLLLRRQWRLEAAEESRVSNDRTTGRHRHR